MITCMILSRGQSRAIDNLMIGNAAKVIIWQKSWSSVKERFRYETIISIKGVYYLLPKKGGFKILSKEVAERKINFQPVVQFHRIERIEQSDHQMFGGGN